MARWNPCCFPLVTGLKTIAYVQIFVAACNFLLEAVSIGIIIGSTVNQTTERISEDEASKLAAVIFSTLEVTLYIAQLGLAVFLLKGAKERNHWKCKIWFIGNCVLLVTDIVLSIITLSIYPSAASYMIGAFIHFGIDIYCLIVVFAFLDELTSDVSNNAGQTA